MFLNSLVIVTQSALHGYPSLRHKYGNQEAFSYIYVGFSMARLRAQREPLSRICTTRGLAWLRG